MEQESERQARQALRNRAIGLLARREHSAQELRSKLASAETPSARLEAVLAQLREHDLQSDARYAESMLRALIQRGQGPLRVRQTLRQKGIDGELLQATLAAAAVDWFAQAVQVHGKRFSGVAAASPKERARQIRFLLYRGFTQDQVGHALDRARDESG